MEVRTCRSCGRMFNCVGRTPLCPACADELEKKFQQVKEYVWEHRSATLQDISENNDVSVKQLRQWVREERLSFSDDSPVGLECEKCGATIKTGRFCENCKNRLNSDLSSVMKRPEAPKEKIKDPRDNKNRMRYLQ